MEHTETLIVEQLKIGNEDAYQYIYDRHYALLCHVASGYVKDQFLAETIVGDTIFHLWEIRETLEISVSIRSYLVRAVRNRCINYLNSEWENRILLASDTTIIGQNIQKTGAFSGRDVKELEAQGYLTGKGMVYCSTKMKRPAWNLIHVIPMDELMEEQRLFAKLFLFR